MASVNFQDWLRELQHLPSSSSQWEHARQFIEHATQIIAEKEDERNQAANLLGAIGDISEKFSDSLRFLSIKEDLALLRPACLPSDIPAAMMAISVLEESLVEFEAFKATNPSLVELIQEADSVTNYYRALRELLEEHKPPEGSESMSPSAELPDEASIASTDELESDEDVETDESGADVSAIRVDGAQNKDKDVARDSYECETAGLIAGENEQLENLGIDATAHPQSEMNGAEHRYEGSAREETKIAEQQHCPEDVASENDNVTLSESNELTEKRDATPVSSDEPIESVLHKDSPIGVDPTVRTTKEPS